MNPTGNITPGIKGKKSKKAFFLKFVLLPILVLIMVVLFFTSTAPGIINYQLKVMSCSHKPIVASEGIFGGANEYYRPQDSFYEHKKDDSSEPIPRIVFMNWGTTTLYCTEKEAINAYYSNDDSPVYRQHVESNLDNKSKDDH